MIDVFVAGVAVLDYPASCERIGEDWRVLSAVLGRDPVEFGVQ